MSKSDINNMATLTLIAQFYELAQFWRTLSTAEKDSHRAAMSALVNLMNETAQARKKSQADDVWRPFLQQITQEWLIAETGPVPNEGADIHE